MKRRMIATEIVSEGRFLRMSLTAQALYMHLLANADDDGCVDAYTITKICGAKEDDLVLLKEREYIVILDEKEWILWISGWQDFNWIDPRIKEDSKYLPLLRARVEGLEIVESNKKEANKRRYAKLKLERALKREKKNDPQDDHRMISGDLQDDLRVIHSENTGRSTNDPRRRLVKGSLGKDSDNPPYPPPGGKGAGVPGKEGKGSLKYLDEAVCQCIADQYGVSLKVVLERREDLRIYCASKGRAYKDYYATLQGWVRDGLKTGRIAKVSASFVPPDTSGALPLEEVRKRSEEIRSNLAARMGMGER
jgi:hypothetical protein